MEQILLGLTKGWTPAGYGIWLIAAIIIIYFIREWRETRKLSSTDRQARREGFERQVEILLNENRKLGEDLRELRREYDNYRRICQEENEQRLSEIRRLEHEVMGLNRQIRATGQSTVRLIRDIEDQADDGDPRGKRS